MATAEETLLVPQNYGEAEELVNKLTIEDLRAFCYTFGLLQDGTKASLKGRLLEHYKGQFKALSGTPVPTPRKKSRAISPQLTDEEPLFPSVAVEQRIDNLELVVSRMREYMDESLSQFRISLTESIKETTERIMRTCDKPSDEVTRIETGSDRFVPDSKFVLEKRKLQFLEKNAKGVCSELEKLLHAGSAPSRVESQLKRLSQYETDCLRSVEEILANVEEDSLIEETLKEWDEFHSGILRISGKAEEFIAEKGLKQSSSEYPENITGVKLPLLQLPKFSGNVLEWSAFYDAFVASVDSHNRLSNVQKFTHLRSCLYGRAYKCIEGYSVTNDNYPKALQDLRGRFGRKRLLVNELVKSILNLDVPEKVDGNSLRHLYDTLRNRMRSLESLGLKPDDNPSLTMVLLPIFDMKLPRELKEKWEFELTKYDNDEEDKEVNIKKFFQFLEGHVLSKESHEDTKNSSPKLKPRKRFGREKRSKIPDDEEYISAQALVGSSDFKKVKCGFCGKNHETVKCATALNKAPDERWEMLMKRKGSPTCFNCLQAGSISHNSRTCKAPRCPVDECGRKHHQLLHTSDKLYASEEDVQILSGFVSAKKQNLLPTACARLIYEDKECPVRLLLDSGSQETFLRKTIAEDLKMKSQGSSATMNIKVLGGQEQRKRMNRVRFTLVPLDSSVDKAVSIDAWTINSVSAPLTAADVDVKKCAHLINLKLADTFPREAAPVDLLIGADQYYKLVQGIASGGRSSSICSDSRRGEASNHYSTQRSCNREVDHACTCECKSRWTRDDSCSSTSTILAYPRKTRSKASFEKMSHLQALEDSASSTKDGTLTSRESTNSTAIYPHWSRFHWSTVPKS